MAEAREIQGNPGTYEDSLIINGSKNKIRKVDERRIEKIKVEITPHLESEDDDDDDDEDDD